jgi:DNA-binding NtrC family response regulator
MDSEERELFIKALEENTVTELAKQVGLSRKTIYKKMRQLGIKPFKHGRKKNSDSRLEIFLRNFNPQK